MARTREGLLKIWSHRTIRKFLLVLIISMLSLYSASLSSKDMKEDGRFLSFYLTNEVFTKKISNLESEISFDEDPNLDIEILDEQSYPAVGHKWEVRFRTYGKANLNIRGINGTTFGDRLPEDLRLVEIRCGDVVITPDVVESNLIRIYDFECDDEAVESSIVMTPGKHIIGFDFGGIKKYAYNSAGAYIRPNTHNDVDGVWTTPAQAYDGDNVTSALGGPDTDDDIYFSSYNNTDVGTITGVNLFLRWDVSGLDAKSGDSITVTWYVAGTQISSYTSSQLLTINNGNQAANQVSYVLGASEPNDGVWTWADINNIEVRWDGTKSGGDDDPTVYIDEVWGIVELAANQVPTWNDNRTSVSSGSEYLTGKNYGFQISWTDPEGALDNVTFETNLRTGGALENITKADLKKYTTFANNTAGVWWVNFTQEQVAGAGSYLFRWYANDTGALENKTSQWNYVILRNQSTLNLIHLKLNGSVDSDGYYTYPEALNATGYKDIGEGVVTLLRNGTSVGLGQTPEDVVRLGGASWNYTVYYPQTQNYTYAQIEHFVYVSKGEPSLTLKLDASSAVSQSRTYPNATDVQGSESNLEDGGCVYVLYLNSTPTANGPITLAARSYNYTYAQTSDSCQNYTKGQNEMMLTVGRGGVNIDVLLNGTLNSEETVQYPSDMNSSCAINISSQNTFLMERNGSSVGTQTGNAIEYNDDLDAAAWNFTCYYDQTENYSAFSRSQFMTVTKGAAHPRLALNDTESDKGYTKGVIANITAWLPDSNLYMTVYSNFSGGPSLANITPARQSPVYNYTDTNNLALGTYIVLANATGNANWTSNYSGINYSVTISFLDLDSIIESIYPVSIDQSQNSSVLGNCSCTGGTCDEVYIEIQADGAAIPTMAGGNLRVNGSSSYYIGPLNDGQFSIRSWNITGLEVGSYDITIKCNSTQTSDRYSDAQTLQVNDTTPTRWSSNVSSPSSGVEYSPARLYRFNATWYDNVEVSTVIIEHNFTGGALPHNETVTTYENNVYYFDLEDLAAGNYTWKMYANDTSDNENWNYTDVWSFDVVQNTTNLVDIYLNGTLDDNKTYTYPETANITGATTFLDSGTLNLYRNGSLVSSGTVSVSLLDRLGAEHYEFKVNITGNQNYSSNSTGTTYYAFVNKGTPLLSTVLDASSAVSQSRTYPNATDVQGSESNLEDGGCVYVLYLNSTPTANGPITLAARSYNYTYAQTSDSCQNYTKGQNEMMLTVGRGGVNINVTLNGTTNDDNSIEYPSDVNATCLINISSQNTFLMERNGTVVGAQVGDAIKYEDDLWPAAWNFTCYYDQTENYSAFSRSQFMTIDKGTIDINLYINGARENKVAYQYHDANFTVVLNNPTSGDLEIWTNYSNNVWKLHKSGIYPPQFENITNLTVQGNWTWTANYTNANYTGTLETWYTNVESEPEFIPIETTRYNLTDRSNNRAYGVSQDTNTVTTPSTNDAYPPLWANGWGGYEFNNNGYTNVDSENGQYGFASSGGNGQEPYLRFNFTINESKTNIQWIYVMMNGKRAGGVNEYCWPYIANFSGTPSWYQFDTEITSTTLDENVEWNITGVTDHYIDSNQQLVLLMYGQAHDSGEGCYVDYVEVLVNAIESQPPSFSENETNTTFSGKPVNFSVSVTDNNLLEGQAGYIFSTNNTGIWENSSFTYFSGSSYTQNAWNISILNSTPGTTVQWRFYANDSVGNWKSSEVYNLTVDGVGLVNITISNITGGTSDSSVILFNSTGDPIVSGGGQILLDLQTNQNYSLQISENVSGENLTIRIEKINITSSINITSQVITNYTELPSGINVITSVIAVNDTHLDYEYATIFIPNETMTVKYVMHCNNGWNYSNASCDPVGNWVLEDPSVYGAKSNSTHIYFNVTSFDAYSGGGVAWIEVNLILPPGNFSIERYDVFDVNATVFCRGANCRDVYGTIRYNQSSIYPDTAVKTSETGEPFYVNETPSLAQKTCLGEQMKQDDYCNITWKINASGALDTSWTVGVLFNSSDTRIYENSTENMTAEIVSCIEEMTIQFEDVDFGTVLPSSYGNPATMNSVDYYNVSNTGTCTSNIWIKSTNFTKDSYSIMYSNLTFNNATNDYSSGYRVSDDYDIGNTTYKRNLGPDTNITGYFFLDVPSIYSGDYDGNITFCINTSERGTIC